MNLYEAIYARSSVRKYRMEPLDEKMLKDISAFIERIEPLFHGIKTSVNIINTLKDKNKFTGIANVKAPYYLAFYSENKEKSEMNAGYILQQIALYLTVKGLGTCYQGMAKKKDKRMEEEGMSCQMMMAFGLPKRFNLTKDHEAKRLTMAELCAYKDPPGSDIKELLETARLAPSALNGQPWRFVVYENRFHIFSKKPVGAHGLFHKQSELEFGILLANVMVAADELWVEVDLIKLNNITHKALPNNQYMISVLAKVFKPGSTPQEV